MSVPRPARGSLGPRLTGFLCVLLLVSASASRDVVSGNNETGGNPARVTQEDTHHRTNDTDHKKTFPVLSLNYERVKTPFEISIWILLALLMKLG